MIYSEISNTQAHLLGSYLASLKAPLWRVRLYSSSGREVSQLEAPFSLAHWRELGAMDVRAVADDSCELHSWP